MSLFRRYGQEPYAVKLPIRSISSYGFVTAKRIRSFGEKTDSVYGSNVFLIVAFRRFGIFTESVYYVHATTFISLFDIQQSTVVIDDINMEFLISLVKERPDIRK